MDRRTDPARRIALSVLLALLPTALMLWLLGSLLISNESTDIAPVISATLIPDEPEPPPPIIVEPSETPLPPDPVPSAAPSTAPQPQPAPTVVSATPEPDDKSDVEDNTNDLPTVNWWQAMDRFIESQRDPGAIDYAKLVPSLPPAVPNEPAFDPTEGWYNGAGELVRNISEHCRAEQRDAIPNDNFVPPPVIFCKRPPALALPLRRPRYLDNEMTPDHEPDKLTRYAFSLDRNILAQ